MILSTARRQIIRVRANRLHVWRSSNFSSSSKSSSELNELRQEIKELRQIIQETNESHTRSFALLAKQVETQTQSAERHLSDILLKGQGNDPLIQVTKAAKDYVQHNETLGKLIEQINTQSHRYPNIFNKFTVGSVAGVIVVVWFYWSSIQRRTSEEVADLASKTLEQETLRQALQETLDDLAQSVEVKQTLTGLLQNLIQDETTQQQLTQLLVYAVGTKPVQDALLDLLQLVFQDEYLQELSGEFLLKGLDVERVRQMLDEQTQSLVKRTVLDEQVQKATGDGVRKSLWYALIPVW